LPRDRDRSADRSRAGSRVAKSNPAESPSRASAAGAGVRRCGGRGSRRSYTSRSASGHAAGGATPPLRERRSPRRRSGEIPRRCPKPRIVGARRSSDVPRDFLRSQVATAMLHGRAAAARSRSRLAPLLPLSNAAVRRSVGRDARALRSRAPALEEATPAAAAPRFRGYEKKRAPAEAGAQVRPPSTHSYQAYQVPAAMMVAGELEQWPGPVVPSL